MTMALLHLLIALLLGGSDTARADTLSRVESTSADNIVWRSERSCGLNCLYVLLGTHNIDVDYYRLATEVIRGEDYTSLTELRLASNRHGLAVNLGRSNPEGLMRLPMPVIAHLELMSPRADTPGHFVLV